MRQGNNWVRCCAHFDVHAKVMCAKVIIGVYLYVYIYIYILILGLIVYMYTNNYNAEYIIMVSIISWLCTILKYTLTWITL